MAKGKHGHNGGGGTPPPTNIPAPTGLTATATMNGVYLQWTPVPNATTYWIYRDPYVLAIITDSAFTDVSVVKGASYNYAVAAVVNSVLGPRSAIVSVTA